MTENTHDHDKGFHHDLPLMLGRRKALAALGGAVITLSSPSILHAASCVANSKETEGPYPADGTNPRSGSVINVLDKDGVIREDIRPSFAGMTPVAAGLPLTIELFLVDVNNACAPLAGRAVYLWHCDAVGKYSLYDYPDRNNLRGVGVSDANGVVRFTTIFPGCYRGRWPHMHFEMFQSVDHMATGRQSILTSQIAFPQNICEAVYAADPVYSNGVRNLREQSFDSDMVFADNSAAQKKQQMVELQGTATKGFHGTTTIGLSA